MVVKGKTKGLLVAGALALSAAAPGTRSHAKATLFLAEILPTAFKPLAALTREPVAEQVAIGEGRALVFHPAGGPSPCLVLIHGANIGGIEDPRIVRSATSLARLGRTVVVPSLALGRRELSRSDIGLVEEAIRLGSEMTGEPVVVVAFSFGAAFTLVALEEEPELQRLVDSVLVIGTYFDLANLVSGVTTGEVDVGDGRMASWSGAEGAPALVAAGLAGQLEPTDRDAFLAAFAARERSGMSPEAASVYDLMMNEDPTKVSDLVLGLPAGLPQLFQDLSPSLHPELIQVPVHALHSTDDPASPASESLRLVKRIGSSGRSTVTVVSALRHVTPTGSPGVWLADARALVSFTAKIFKPQEPLVPFR